MASAEAPRRLVVTLALLALGVLVAATVEASLLRGFPLAELRQRAAVIAEGRVASTAVLEHRGTIETETILQVERAWKGDPPAGVAIRTPGGRLDGRHLQVAGVPRFAVGERVVVFLYRDGDRFRPVGMFQGVWRVDAETPGVARASRARGASLLIAAAEEPAVSLGPTPIVELVGGATPRPEPLSGPQLGDRR